MHNIEEQRKVSFTLPPFNIMIVTKILETVAETHQLLAASLDAAVNSVLPMAQGSRRPGYQSQTN